MRALVQRVSEAGVAVGGEEIAAIDGGLLVLVGVGQLDLVASGSHALPQIVDRGLGSVERRSQVGKERVLTLEILGKLCEHAL